MNRRWDESKQEWPKKTSRRENTRYKTCYSACYQSKPKQAQHSLLTDCDGILLCYVFLSSCSKGVGWGGCHNCFSLSLSPFRTYAHCEILSLRQKSEWSLSRSLIWMNQADSLSEYAIRGSNIGVGITERMVYALFKCMHISLRVWLCALCLSSTISWADVRVGNCILCYSGKVLKQQYEEKRDKTRRERCRVTLPAFI